MITSHDQVLSLEHTSLAQAVTLSLSDSVWRLGFHITAYIGTTFRSEKSSQFSVSAYK